jgi:hypothetical protein
MPTVPGARVGIVTAEENAASVLGAPPPRHAVIASWPPEVEKRRATAMELAKHAGACGWP